MGNYRDESEALRARIGALESELAGAKQRIAELSGEGAAPPPAPSGFWIAAPTTLLLERELDVEPTPELVDRLASVFRRELPLGTMTPSERAFQFRQGALDASLTPIGGGRARLRLYVDHRGYAMLPGFMTLMLGLVAMPAIGALLGPLAVLAILPIAWALGFVLLRRVFGAQLHRHRARFTKLFEAAAAIATTPNVRVAVPTEAVEARAEAEEEEEASERERRA